MPPRLLGDTLKDLSHLPKIEETGLTLKKMPCLAKTISRLTNLFADDSGLEVFYLVKLVSIQPGLLGWGNDEQNNTFLLVEKNIPVWERDSCV